MSMARQQSTQQQSAPVPEQVQTNTADLDPLGNAQRTEDAGLSGQGTAPDDMGLLGPLASVILDAMPLPMALMTAKGAIESPHVQGWVRSLDFLDVAQRLGSLANTLLTAAWPVGIGVDVEGQVAGQLVGGVDLLGRVTAMRRTVSELHLQVQRRGKLSCGGAVGVQLANAFEDKVGALAKADLSIMVEDNSDVVLDVDLIALIETVGRIQPDFLIEVLRGEVSGRGLLDMGANIAQFLEALTTETVGMDWKHSPLLSIGAGAQAFAGNDLSVANLLDGASDQLPMLLQAITTIAQRVAGIGGVRVDLAPAGWCQFDARYVCEVGAAAQLFSMEPQLGNSLDQATLDWFIQGQGAQLGLSLQMPLTLDPIAGIVLPDVQAAMVTLRARQEMGAAQLTEGQTVPLSALPTLIGTMSNGGTLDALVQEGGFPTHERTLQMEVTAAQMDTVFPEWIRLIGAMPDGMIPSETVLHVEGQAALSSDAIHTLLGRGITLPPSTNGMTACWDLGNLLIDLATGNTMTEWPAWLAGHESALFEVATQVQVHEARLRGHIHLGQGGSVEAGAGVEASGTARTEGGIVLDQALEPSTANRVVRALGGNQSAA